MRHVPVYDDIKLPHKHGREQYQVGNISTLSSVRCNDEQIPTDNVDDICVDDQTPYEYVAIHTEKNDHDHG